MIDEHVLNKIVETADISENDVVIEIGPGIGTLTCELAKRAFRVIAVEIDKTLIPALEDTLSEYNNIDIINQDILKVDINEIAERYNGKNLKVVANLPYYITTPIIMGMLENRIPVKSITVMIQKEVAYRMKADTSTKDYGSLSLIVQYYCDVYLAANVPMNCFIPRPSVDSAVIRLTVKENSKVCVADEKLLFKIIKIAFSQRRKTLLNCIYNSGEFDLSKNDIIKILNDLGFEENIRGEKLKIEDFALLCDALSKY